MNDLHTQSRVASGGGPSQSHRVTTAQTPKDAQSNQTTTRKGVSERRMSQRFPVKKRAFALLRSKSEGLREIRKMTMGEIGMAVFKAKPEKLGQIHEMSTRGLSFHYIPCPGESSRPNQLDILMAEGRICLQNIKFKKVSDRVVDNGKPYHPVKTKQLGIKFVDLNRKQKQDLKNFIRQHARER